MSVLGRLAGAVVRRGSSLLRREATDASRRGVRRVAVEGTAGFRRAAPRGLGRGEIGPSRGVYKSTGVRASDYETGRSPLLEGSSSSLLGGETSRTVARGSFKGGAGAGTGKFGASRIEPSSSSVVAKKTTRGPEALRRASVVGRRYFTQGTAGQGVNVKRAAIAGSAAAVPVAYGTAEGIKAVQRKVNGNSQGAQRSQRSAETASQATPTSSSIAAAELSSSGSPSSSGSTSTDQTPVSRTNSTTGVGGALQDEMRASAKAVRPDRDYMGESFDATLRKGVSSGRAYLKQQLASDKIDSKRQRTLLDQYDRRIGKDTLLGRDRGVGYVSKADTDQTQKDLLSAYRGRFGSYRKNATAGEIEAMAKTAAAKRGS